MIRGKIDQVKDSQSGQSLSVWISGQKYTTQNWEFRGYVGKTVEFEPSSSEYKGTMMHWINEYTEVQPTADDQMNQAMANQPPTPPAEAYQAPSAAPQAPVTRDASIYLPMTSNVVAHAIQAGLIKEPGDLEKWACAALSAAKSAIEVPY